MFQVFYNNDEWTFYTAEDKNRMKFFSHKDSTMFGIPFPEKFDAKMEWLDQFIIYNPSIMVDFKKKQIVLGSNLLGQIEFFDFEGNLLHKLEFEKNLIERKDFGQLYNVKSFIFQLESDGQFIYALNKNNRLGATAADDDWQAMQLLVFDKNGTLLKTLPFSDQKFITSIALDRKEQKLYAYSLHEEKHNIFVYDLE